MNDSLEEEIEEAPEWVGPLVSAMEEKIEELEARKRPDPRELPDDQQFAVWMDRFGNTGVKTYALEGHPQNEGCVAVYREMSMRERGMMARLEEIDEEHPGAYDYMKMLVSSCLLHPTLEAYPHPTFAASELFNRMRVHGHGPLPEDDLEPEEAATSVPGHMAEDIKNARETARRLYEDGRYTSLYKDLIVQLATRADGTIDIVAFEELWSAPPGKLRDLAGKIERARMEIREAQFELLEEELDDAEQRREQAKQIDRKFPSPFEHIDEASEGATIPDAEAEDEEPAPTDEAVGSYREEDIDSERLPPDAAGREEMIEDLRSAKTDDPDTHDPIPPNV